MHESAALCPRYIEVKGKVTEAMAPDPSRKLHAGPGPSAPPLAGPPAKHANTPGKWPPDPCARMLRVSLRRGPGGTPAPAPRLIRPPTKWPPLPCAPGGGSASEGARASIPEGALGRRRRGQAAACKGMHEGEGRRPQTPEGALARGRRGEAAA